MNLKLRFVFFVFALLILVSNQVKANNPIGYRIHVIGDSHSQFSFGDIENCTIHWLGPITMHRIGKKGTKLLDLRKFDIQEGDTVIFVFGEIDVRCHIAKQRDLHHRNVNNIIENLVQNYSKILLENRRLFTHLNCVICAVLPPTNQGYNPEFPIWGSLYDRILFTKQLNRRLHEVAIPMGLHVFDIPQEYATAEGNLNPIFSDGFVHIGQGKNSLLKAALAELLKKLYH